MTEGDVFEVAVQKVLERIITLHGAVVYNGDGYTDEWQEEAAARGLPNLRTTLDALPALITDEAIELFSHYGVFSPRSCTAATTSPSSSTPSASVSRPGRRWRWPTRSSCPPPCGTRRSWRPIWPPQGDRRRARHHHPRRGLDQHQGVAGRHRGLRTALTHDSDRPTRRRRARPRRPAAGHGGVRHAADELETLVADDLWPLPTYQEMLFIL